MTLLIAIALVLIWIVYDWPIYSPPLLRWYLARRKRAEAKYQAALALEYAPTITAIKAFTKREA